jgi:Zn-dependent M28 family amino/carboxypeptidase
MTGRQRTKRNSKTSWTLAVVSLSLLVGGWAAAATDDSDATDSAMAQIHPDSLRANMRFLADDLLEGRGTATRGHLIAARFMATRFESYGFQAAGDDNTYFQKVPLRSMRVDAAATTFATTLGGQTESLTFGQDFIALPDPARSDATVEAPIVFVGYGITAQEQNYDDYKGVDVHGKIVAYFYGAPNFQSSLKAHFSSTEVKARNAVAHGAVGMLLLLDPVLESEYPFAKISRDATQPKFRWLDPKGQPNPYFPELRAGAVVGIAQTKKLFAGSGHTAEEEFAAAKAGKSTAFPLKASAKIHVVTKAEDVQSVNVVAKLEGSDPVLKDQDVVYTAHLDHLGIGAAVNGDNIYNGALDNASGSAALLELARAFSSMHPRPKRSILLVSVTGEEAGLLGSEYFASYPTIPKQNLVADINIDEILMLWPIKDVIAFGAEHSTLESDVSKAAERMHLTESPDPMPQEVVFIRSDQYSFVKQGIPSVMLSPGFQSADSKLHPMELFQKWEATRYHQPQDDMSQPGLDFESGAKLIRMAYLCGYYVAQAPERPAWNAGDFFGEKYAKGR